MHEYLQPIIQYLHTHPHWGNFVAFLTAFVESLAVIGTVVPGSVTMTALGVLMGMGVLSPVQTLFWIVLGAYLGDCLSYWFGSHYGQGIRKMWPFYKYPEWLTKGENFFKSHGGKSVLIGRFTGPVRSVVPMIAGLLHMPPLRFLPAALVTVIIWAIIYITPGVILGAVSLELPPKVATQFVVICLVIIAILWVITWLIKLFFGQVWNQIDRLLIKCWNYLNIHKTSHWLTQLLRNPTHKEDHQQLVRGVFALIFLALFIIMVIAIVTHNRLTHFNIPLYHLLQSLRGHTLDHFSIAITLLGDKSILLPTAAIILIWFCWHQRWWTALHWAGIITVSTLLIELCKRLVYSARPPIVLLSDASSSFPSGHTVLSITFYGFLAVVIADNLIHKHKSRPYIVAITLTILIALSRLYLGAHWLTDIVASLFLGMTLILLTTLSYRRRNLLPIPASILTILALTTLFIVTIAYGYLNFKPLEDTFAINWPIALMKENNWWRQTPGTIYYYRTSRTGHPAQPLNIQWLGNLTNIEAQLKAQGWESQVPRLNLNSTVARLVPSDKQKLPLIPPLYHHRAPELLMTKVLPNSDKMLILRLWSADINIERKKSIAALWIGMINFYTPPTKLLNLPEGKRRPESFQSASSALTPYLNQYQWRQLQIPLPQAPVEKQHLDWDGKVLLIKEK